MVTALGDLEIGVVRRRQLQSRSGCFKSLGKGLRGRGAHGADDRVVGLRACDGGKIGKPLADQSRLSAHATGHDHGTARGLRLSDGVEAFLTRRVEESAGVHDDGVGVRIVADRLISLTTKPCQDPLGIHQRLGAAQADHADRAAARRVRLNGIP